MFKPGDKVVVMAHAHYSGVVGKEGVVSDLLEPHDGYVMVRFSSPDLPIAYRGEANDPNIVHRGSEYEVLETDLRPVVSV